MTPYNNNQIILRNGLVIPIKEQETIVKLSSIVTISKSTNSDGFYLSVNDNIHYCFQYQNDRDKNFKILLGFFEKIDYSKGTF